MLNADVYAIYVCDKKSLIYGVENLSFIFFSSLISPKLKVIVFVRFQRIKHPDPS